MEPEEMRYCSTGEVHLDFHGSTYVGLKYLLDHFGMEAVNEVLDNTALKVYRSIAERMARGDTSELICFWRYYLEREKADFTLTEDGNGGAVLELRECPALRHLAKEKVTDRSLICHATERMNDTWCNKSPFQIILEHIERGCRQTLCRKEGGK
jgi:hypothetical protein